VANLLGFSGIESLKLAGSERGRRRLAPQALPAPLCPLHQSCVSHLFASVCQRWRALIQPSAAVRLAHARIFSVLTVGWWCWWATGGGRACQPALMRREAAVRSVMIHSRTILRIFRCVPANVRVWGLETCVFFALFED